MTDARIPILAAFYGTHGYTENDKARAVQALALLDAADREQGFLRLVDENTPAGRAYALERYGREGDLW